MIHIKLFEAFVDNYDPDRYTNTWNQDEIEVLLDHGFDIHDGMNALAHIIPDVTVKITKDTYFSTEYDVNVNKASSTLKYTVKFSFKKKWYQHGISRSFKCVVRSWFITSDQYLPYLQHAMDWIYLQSTKRDWLKYEAKIKKHTND